MNGIMKLFSVAKDRSVLAHLIILLTFGVVFKILHDDHVTVEEMGVLGTTASIATLVASYYFGSSKSVETKTKQE